MNQFEAIDEQKENDQQHEKEINDKGKRVGGDGLGLAIEEKAHFPSDFRNGSVEFLARDGEIEFCQKGIDAFQQGAVGEMGVYEIRQGRASGQLNELRGLLGQNSHEINDGDEKQQKNQKAGEKRCELRTDFIARQDQSVYGVESARHHGAQNNDGKKRREQPSHQRDGN